jgi:hypothetical protein
MYLSNKGKKMIAICDEFAILRKLIRMYDDAFKVNNPIQMMEIAVDIAESAVKLEQHSVDHANLSE